MSSNTKSLKFTLPTAEIIFLRLTRPGQINLQHTHIVDGRKSDNETFNIHLFPGINHCKTFSLTKVAKCTGITIIWPRG